MTRRKTLLLSGRNLEQDLKLSVQVNHEHARRTLFFHICNLKFVTTLYFYCIFGIDTKDGISKDIMVMVNSIEAALFDISLLFVDEAKMKISQLLSSFVPVVSP